MNVFDLRNKGIIELLRPEEATFERVRSRLASATPKASPAEVDERARRFMQSLASKYVRPPSPISEPPSEDKKDLTAMSADPELVVRIWPRDDEILQKCRWRVFGRPALVHPATGVIFAVAIGNIGIAVRLPTNTRSKNAGRAAGSRQNPFDLMVAGPEWVFTLFSAERAAFREAREYAGAPAAPPN